MNIATPQDFWSYGRPYASLESIVLSFIEVYHDLLEVLSVFEGRMDFGGVIADRRKWQLSTRHQRVFRNSLTAKFSISYSTKCIFRS